MLSNICLCGRLGKPVSDLIRYVEIERGLMYDNKEVTDYIPVSHWNPVPKNHLMSLDTGTLVVISGRLQRDEKIGLYIVCETLEYLGKSKLKEV